MLPAIKPQELSQLVIAQTVVKLRREGYSLEEIAGAVAMSPLRVSAMLEQAIADVSQSTQEQAKVILEMELQRLDVALKSIWPRVEAGDEDAISTMVMIMNRRAKYLGLDYTNRIGAKPNTTVVIEWAGPGRLAYKQQLTIDQDTHDPEV